MGNKLYVGNLPYSFRDEDMQQAFAAFGTVSSAKVMMERDTGRSKGGARADSAARGRSLGCELRHASTFGGRGEFFRRRRRRFPGGVPVLRDAGDDARRFAGTRQFLIAQVKIRPAGWLERKGANATARGEF